MLILETLLLMLAAYLVGSTPAAYLAARWSRRIDIRQYGSGNVGASNLIHLTSIWVALPVIIFDIGKGMLMVWLARLLGLGIVPQVLVGIAAIAGHSWPVFLGFNGGRGILTSLGVITMLSPWLGLIGLVISYGMAPFHLLALGVIIALAALPVFSWFLPGLLGIKEPLPATLGLIALFLLGAVRRLTAPRTPFTETVTRGELLYNRFFLDRDIKDRKAWVDRDLKTVKKASGSK
jgi:glycerol-3-phosphate acyltransferase PlsY